ncbi:hypothetical protein PVAND_005083 [Polypedilum vanderplanki]|uniref:C2H2-type domain-containing protein n=1 Tax=Polypedilum vanderplanki TaxID=319348 RepID=A0A9J6BZZ4_POLVA|nr:hypothetical protein PVAND_005083 [Polypedilum vanderplanki]
MNKNKQIVCEVCGELIDEDKYKRHIKNGHKDKRDFRCDICAKEFTSNYNLQYHIAHHLNERNFICNECPRAYNTSADLVQHQRIHEKQRDPYKCEECNLFFEIRSRYNTHMRIHKTTVKGPKVCPVCNKNVMDVKRHHDTVHMNIRNHECDFCFKKFNKKSGLERHVLTVHEKQKNFICEICNAAFGEKSLMLRHIKRHSAVKTSFYCTICKKYVSQIKEHYNTTHKDLPHSCEFCYRRFLKRREYNNHVMTRHTKIRKWLCQLCGKGFVEMYQLKRHFKTHINVDRVTEEDVEKLIENLENSKRKKVAKNYDCDFCNKKFKKKYDIDRHMQSRHKDQKKLGVSVICDKCGKSFDRFSTLEKHLRNHLDFIEIKGEEHTESETDERKNNFDFTEEERKIVPLEIDVETITIKKEPEFIDYNDDDHSFEGFSQNDNLEIKSEDDNLELKDEAEENHPVEKPEDIEEKKKEKLQIRCKVCHNIFTTKNEFREHFMTQHAGENKTSYECKECQKVFDNKKTLISHFKRTHERNDCTECEEIFSSKSELEKHFQKCHDEEEKDQFMCSYCGKILMTERNLKLHIHAIHKNLRYDCTVCSKSFTYKSAMYRHRDREHGKGKIFQCDKCPQRVGTKHELILHNERHHNSMREIAKPEYMCVHCGICFPSSFVLSRHERRIHGVNGDIDDQKECGICHEQFKDFYWKRKHTAQVHLNGKRIMRRCQYCSAEFKLYIDFKNHIESHVGIFICTICGEPFNDLQELSLHGQIHKKIESTLRKYICDHCGHRLFTKVQLQQHMLKHTQNFDVHYCDVCGKSFKFASSLYTHRKYHGEGEFVCSYCSRRFARNSDLVNHIRVHSGEKPFKCQVCGKNFAQKQALYYHHQTHPETRASANCKECNITFSDRKQLKFHEEQVHPDSRPFRCFVCNMTFKYEHNLRRHNTDKHKV